MKRLMASLLFLLLMVPLWGCKTLSPEHQVLDRTYETMIETKNYEYTVEVAFDGKVITYFYSLDGDLMFYRFERFIHDDYLGPYHHGEIRYQYIRFEEDKEILYTNRHNDYVIRYDYFVTEASAADVSHYDEVREHVALDLIKEYANIASIEEQDTAWVYTFVIPDFDIETFKSVCDTFPLRKDLSVDSMSFVVRIEKSTTRVRTITSAFVLHSDQGDLNIELTISFSRFGLVSLELPTNLVE